MAGAQEHRQQEQDPTFTCRALAHPPRRRSTEEGAGPRGGDSPYISPEGHALIDVRFCEPPFFSGRPALDGVPLLAQRRPRGQAQGPRGPLARGACPPTTPRLPRSPHADEGLKLFGEDADYGAIAREIEGVPGVVAHGLVSWTWYLVGFLGGAAAVPLHNSPLGLVKPGPLPPPRCAEHRGRCMQHPAPRQPTQAQPAPSPSIHPLPQMANVAAAAIVAGRDGAPPRLMWRGGAAGAGAA